MGCRCPGPLPERKTRWIVTTREGNRSAFNGRRFTHSAYSEVVCLRCVNTWRTKAAYVSELPDGTCWDVEDTRPDRTLQLEAYQLGLTCCRIYKTVGMRGQTSLVEVTYRWDLGGRKGVVEYRPSLEQYVSSYGHDLAVGTERNVLWCLVATLKLEQECSTT